MSNLTDKKRFTLDSNAALTEQQQAELAVLRSMSDDEVDFSDSPPLTKAFWDNAVVNPFFRLRKAEAIVEVDSDVLLWLRSKGKGYQTRVNEILRAEMLKEQRH